MNSQCSQTSLLIDPHVFLNFGMDHSRTWRKLTLKLCHISWSLSLSSELTPVGSQIPVHWITQRLLSWSLGLCSATLLCFPLWIVIPTVSRSLQPRLPWIITLPNRASLLVNNKPSCASAALAGPGLVSRSNTWHPLQIFLTTCVPPCCLSSRCQQS